MYRSVAWERSDTSQDMSDSIRAAGASPCHHGTPVAYEGGREGNGCFISWSGLTPWHSNAHTSMPRQPILKRHGRAQQESVPKRESDKERKDAPENSLRASRQDYGCPSESACASHSCAQSPLSPANSTTVPSWPSPCTPHAVRDSHTPKTFGETPESESVGPPACESHLGASFVSVGLQGLASTGLGSEGGGNLHMCRSGALANTMLEAYEKGSHWGQGEGLDRESKEGGHQGGQAGMVSKEVRSMQGSDPAPTWRVRKGNCGEGGGDQEEGGEEEEKGGEEGDSFEVTQVQRGLQAARDGHQRLWLAAQRWEQGPFARYGWSHLL